MPRTFCAFNRSEDIDNGIYLGEDTDGNTGNIREGNPKLKRKCFFIPTKGYGRQTYWAMVFVSDVGVTDGIRAKSIRRF